MAKSTVTVKQVISVEHVDNGYGDCSLWGNRLEFRSGDTEISVRLTDEQLTYVRDKLNEKFPVENLEEVELD